MTTMTVEPVTNLEQTIAFCLEKVRRTREGPNTLLLAGSAYTEASRERLWAVLEDVESWPRWSPLHTATRWTGSASLAVGPICTRNGREVDAHTHDRTLTPL